MSEHVEEVLRVPRGIDNSFKDCCFTVDSYIHENCRSPYGSECIDLDIIYKRKIHKISKNAWCKPSFKRVSDGRRKNT